MLPLNSPTWSTRIRTYSELAWIDFYAADGQDDVITDACQQLDDSLTEAGDILFSAASKAISNDTSKEFSAFLGEDLTADLEDYEDMTDREWSAVCRCVRRTATHRRSRK